MAKAKKLPSGSWRCLVYDYTDSVGKRHYKSITSNDPSPRGRREAELKAAEYQAQKSIGARKKSADYGDMTLTEAIDKYVESRELLNRSPTTVQDYQCIQRNAFQDLMDMQLKNFDVTILQEAINVEARRPAHSLAKKGKTISAKRVKNEWGLVGAVLHKYRKDINLDEIELPQVTPRNVELPSAHAVIQMVHGTEIELPVLLAMWLSFSMSEVRGLTKSKSISGDYLTIREVIVDVDGKPYKKDMAKNPTRNRRHRIPAYIKALIDKVEGDVLVPIDGRTLYRKWIRLQDKYGMDHITFHDLRHLNASVMAMLRIPDKYAQERGGWKSDKVMKNIYMQTFSEERERVDNVIDEYFNQIMQHEIQHE
mgnify:CR=1 FL=1